MLFISAQNFESLRKIIFLIIVFFVVISVSFFSKSTVKAAQIGSLNITGMNISNYSATTSTVITPVITFALPGGLISSNTLMLNFNGVVTQSAISGSDITMGGSCSGSPVLNSAIGGNVSNPTFSITNLTCGTGTAFIQINPGKLSTISSATKANISISTPLDFGQFVFFVGGGNQVNITAQVVYTINIKVYPEKRIPATGNWLNQNTILIRPTGSTTTLVSQVVNMNTAGDGVMVNVDPALVPGGTYDFAIKGYSHLRKIYPGTISTAVTNLDFTGPGLDMLAGDTSVIEDNYVNSLDLSNLSRNLYTSDIKNDLNRDTGVNSLDLSNMAFNLYKSGAN